MPSKFCQCNSFEVKRSDKGWPCFEYLGQGLEAVLVPVELNTHDSFSEQNIGIFRIK